VENLLWRLNQGQVDGINPKLVVLLIGTNNIGRNSADQIAEGIKVAVTEYEKRCPSAHIVLMGIFPRDAASASSPRKTTVAVNSIIASLDDGKRVTFVDISPKLTEPDGSISLAMMPDFLHPTEKGYQIWADAIQALVDKYCGPEKTGSQPVNVVPPSANSATITFSGMYTKNNPLTGQAHVPQSYQPLISPIADTTPIDGGNLGIKIAWAGAIASNRGVNSGVQDHTHDSAENGSHGGAVMFGLAPMSMTFSQPVEIPSLFWTYYKQTPDAKSQGSISVYTAKDDAAPAKSVPLNYTDATGYVWYKQTEFEGMFISKIVFTPAIDKNGKSYPLNIDDVVIRAKVGNTNKP
jgi:hypothetical protein